MTPPDPTQPAASDAEPPAPRRRNRVFRQRIEGALCWVNPDVAERHGVPGTEALTPLLRAAALGAFEPERRLKADRRSEVVQFLYGDRHWVLKRYRTPALRTRLLHAVRRSPVWREWRAARRLADHGIRGCPPLALIHRTDAAGCTQALLLPHVEGERLDEVLRRAGSSGASAQEERNWRLGLARAIGRQAGFISRAGLANRDHKPTNLLIDGPCRDRGAQPVLIDPIGLRRRRSARPVWRMLAQLHRTARKAGDVSFREELACLRAVLRADPTLLADQPHRLRRAAEAVDRARSAAGRSAGTQPSESR